MSTKKFSLFGILFSALLMVIVTSTTLSITQAEPVVMDINKALDPGPGFGEEKIGTLTMDVQNRTIDISVNMTEMPKPDKVFEAWLVDADGSNYKLSLGAIEAGSLKTSEHMINPYTYTEFIITEEPKDDVDPNAAGTYGGAELSTPFGR